MSRLASFKGAVLAATLAFAGAPAAALGDSVTSANWAGYVAHKSRVNFRSVVATWKQPAAVCNNEYPTFSAIWVGLGGYNQSSSALEQVGTELDCSVSGIASASAWYELVPAPATNIAMRINTGDTIKASVTVVGRRVTVALTDATRHRSFSKTISAASVDVTSADWIVEAPSECLNNNFCRTLPLTDFGSVLLSGASAQTTTGRRGSISSSLWGRTKITLLPGGRTYIVFGIAAQATPSALTRAGSAFAVTYSQTSVPPPPLLLSKRASAARSASAVQPGGRRG